MGTVFTNEIEFLKKQYLVFIGKGVSSINAIFRLDNNFKNNITKINLQPQ